MGLRRFFSDFTPEKRNFIIFLVLHLLVWTCIGLIRTVLPTDSLEGIYWGSLHDFGTPKHPPLAGWITYITYFLFKSDFSIYLLSQAFILCGFIYIYKLARKFLDVNQSMLSVVLLEGCWCYTYITGYYGFNPDVILLFTLPAIAYYFYNCMTENNLYNWLMLGIITGFSFLNKYQTALIIIPMAIWAFMFKKDVFKNKLFYIAVGIAFCIFLPHILWLFKYDFFPFMYFEGELTSYVWYNHITAPLLFLLMQFALIAGTLGLFFVLKKYAKSDFVLYKNQEKKDFWFFILLGFCPLLIHFLLGLYDGGTMRPRWGYEFWFLLGIMLFYFFPIKVEQKEFNFGIKLGYFAMIVTFIAMGTLLSVEKNYRSRYPVAQIYNDMQQIWSENNSTPLKYLGGYIEWTLPLTIYNNDGIVCLLDTFGYKSPWVDENDQKRNGTLIIDREKDGVEYYTKLSCPFLPEDYKVKPIEYKFTVTNAFNKPREYTVFYAIIPSQNK